MEYKNRRFLLVYFGLVICFSALLIFACKPNQKAEERITVVDVETLKLRLILELEEDSKTGTKISRGTFSVFEDRASQKAVCEFWPRSVLPKNYGDPVSVAVPILLLSGTMDPVTPPRWGEEAASHLPNSLHLVVPGSHGVGGKCILAIQKQFLETGSVDELDISCTESMKLPRFQIQKR